MFNSRMLLNPDSWKVNKIGVIGPGAVGMPMAALLADARIKIGSDKPAKVTVVQRDSNTSGWKKDAINNGTPAALTNEPELCKIIARATREGLLTATHDYNLICDADVVLVCVKTSVRKLEPDYNTLITAVKDLARALKKRPAGKIPLVIFESTLAPTTVSTLIWDLFDKNGLTEGKNILLGYSPSNVTPGRLVQSVRNCDKLAGGLHPGTSDLIEIIYKNIVKGAKIYQTNCLTAEIAKIFINAYREVRMAFSSEIAWYCQNKNIDFGVIREKVNQMLFKSLVRNKIHSDLNFAGISFPEICIGEHCYSKESGLLFWRYSDAGNDTAGSIILKARQINEETPVVAFKQSEDHFGRLKGNRIALLGVTSRFNPGYAKNSATLVLANYLRKRRFSYILHDPFLKNDDPDILKNGQENFFSNDLDEVLQDADYIFICTAHDIYIEYSDRIFSNNKVRGVMDACNIYNNSGPDYNGIKYNRIGFGREEPSQELIDFVYQAYKSLEKLLAFELSGLVEFYNTNFVFDSFNKVNFSDIKSHVTDSSEGFFLDERARTEKIPDYKGFRSKLLTQLKI